MKGLPMSLFYYFYHLKVSFRKLFYSNKMITAQQEDTTLAEKISAENKYNLKLKCTKAAEEIQHIKSFSHWPITKAKINSKSEQSSLIYLNINRNKRVSSEKIKNSDNKPVEINDKVTLCQKIGTVKSAANIKFHR